MASIKPRLRYRIITMGTLRAFQEAPPEAAHALDAWISGICRDDFSNFEELRERTRGNVDRVHNSFIFNILGGNYRLIVGIQWKYKEIYLKHFMTHKEYDRWSQQQNSKQAKQQAKEERVQWSKGENNDTDPN